MSEIKSGRGTSPGSSWGGRRGATSPDIEGSVSPGLSRSATFVERTLQDLCEETFEVLSDPKAGFSESKPYIRKSLCVDHLLRLQSYLLA
jgi:hypothetical protein